MKWIKLLFINKQMTKSLILSKVIHEFTNEEIYEIANKKLLELIKQL